MYVRDFLGSVGAYVRLCLREARARVRASWPRFVTRICISSFRKRRIFIYRKLPVVVRVENIFFFTFSSLNGFHEIDWILIVYPKIDARDRKGSAVINVANCRLLVPRIAWLERCSYSCADFRRLLVRAGFRNVELNRFVVDKNIRKCNRDAAFPGRCNR